MKQNFFDRHWVLMIALMWTIIFTTAYYQPQISNFITNLFIWN